MTEVNERKIKLSGTANIPKDLEITKSYGLLIDNAEVRKIDATPNDDGTINKTYHIKISEMSQVQIVDGKEIIKTNVKSSPSKRLRSAIYYSRPDKDESYYNGFINHLIINLEEYLEKYER